LPHREGAPSSTDTPSNKPERNARIHAARHTCGRSTEVGYDDGNDGPGNPTGLGCWAHRAQEVSRTHPSPYPDMYLGDAHIMMDEEGFWQVASAARDETKSEASPGEQGELPILQDMLRLLQERMNGEGGDAEREKEEMQLEKEEMQRIHRLEMKEIQKEIEEIQREREETRECHA
jgi:hypothetical protein